MSDRKVECIRILGISAVCYYGRAKDEVVVARTLDVFRCERRKRVVKGVLQIK